MAIKTTKEKKDPKPKSVGRVTIQTLSDLEMALEGDKNKVLFFLAWLKCKRNATEAYLFLNPNVTRESAAVLGSKILRSINIGVIAEGYGLGTDAYFETLSEGLNATTTDVVSKRVVDKKGNIRIVDEVVEKPNWDIKNIYHGKLGRLLGYEQDPKSTTIFQMNQNQQNNVDNISDGDLDLLLER